MTWRIDCRDLVDEEQRMRAALPRDLQPAQWNPGQLEPRPEWHGRECARLAPGVFRFLDEKSPKYHLIADQRLVEIPETTDQGVSA